MKIIYIDIDGVVADFDKGKKKHPLGNITPYIGRPDKLPGIYEKLEPIKDSIISVNKLLNSDLFDVLEYISFNIKPIARIDRVEKTSENIQI